MPFELFILLPQSLLSAQLRGQLVDLLLLGLDYPLAVDAIELVSGWLAVTRLQRGVPLRARRKVRNGLRLLLPGGCLRQPQRAVSGRVRRNVGHVEIGIIILIRVRLGLGSVGGEIIVVRQPLAVRVALPRRALAQPRAHRVDEASIHFRHVIR